MRSIRVFMYLVLLTTALTACGTSSPELPEPEMAPFEVTSPTKVTAGTNEIVVFVAHIQSKQLALFLLYGGAITTLRPESSPVNVVFTRKFTFHFDHAPEEKEVEAARDWVINESMDECSGPCEGVIVNIMSPQ